MTGPGGVNCTRTNGVLNMYTRPEWLGMAKTNAHIPRPVPSAWISARGVDTVRRNRRAAASCTGRADQKKLAVPAQGRATLGCLLVYFPVSGDDDARPPAYGRTWLGAVVSPPVVGG